MTEPDGQAAEPSRTLKVLKGVAMLLALGSVLSVLAIIFVVMRSEMRHRPSECPFSESSLRAFSAEVSVREEARSCDENTEEHQFWLLRSGQEPRLLGGRRLPKDRYVERRYRWSIDEGERGIVIHIENDGVEDAAFYELPPERPSHTEPESQEEPGEQ